jgi:hypothetical protein
MEQYPPSHITSEQMWVHFNSFRPVKGPFGLDWTAPPGMVKLQPRGESTFARPWENVKPLNWKILMRRYYSALSSDPEISHTSLFDLEYPLTCGEVATEWLRHCSKIRRLGGW